jgi:hypothetical protein
VLAFHSGPRGRKGRAFTEKLQGRDLPKWGPEIDWSHTISLRNDT